MLYAVRDVRFTDTYFENEVSVFVKWTIDSIANKSDKEHYMAHAP